MNFEENEIIQLLKNCKNKKEIESMLTGLSVREAKALREKFGDDLKNISNLEDIGKKFEITKKRIQEIEKKALKKLKGRGELDDESSPT